VQIRVLGFPLWIIAAEKIRREQLYDKIRSLSFPRKTLGTDVLDNATESSDQTGRYGAITTWQVIRGKHSNLKYDAD
jgi:hypothetical protein